MGRAALRAASSVPRRTTGSSATYRSRPTRTPRASMSTWGRRGLSRAVRRRVLERDGGVCQLGYPGCTYVATEIDDIIPVSQLGDVTREELTDDNRQAVCAACHHRKTEAHKLAAIENLSCTPPRTAAPTAATTPRRDAMTPSPTATDRAMGWGMHPKNPGQPAPCGIHRTSLYGCFPARGTTVRGPAFGG